MPNLLPHLIDMPMSLGDHLHELRKRLMIPVAAMLLLFIVGVVISDQLKLWLVLPLERAITIIGPEAAAKANLPYNSPRILYPSELGESAMMSMQVSFLFALVLSIPVLMFQLWRFIVVGLRSRERQLGFLFLPLGIFLFYVGLVLGYLYALPYLWAWLIRWDIDDPISATLLPKMSFYYDSFVALTVCFGLVMDIPWLVLVLVRVGLVSIEQFSKQRRMVILVNVVVAACITPGGDLASLTAVFVPMQFLFEAGLVAARFLRWRDGKPAKLDDGGGDNE